MNEEEEERNVVMPWEVAEMPIIPKPKLDRLLSCINFVTGFLKIKSCNLRLQVPI